MVSSQHRQAAVTWAEPPRSAPPAAGPSASGDRVGDVLGSGGTGAAQRRQQRLVTMFPEDDTTPAVREKTPILRLASGEMGTNSPPRVSSLQQLLGMLLEMRPLCLCDALSPSLCRIPDRTVSRALSLQTRLGAQGRSTAQAAERCGHRGLLGVCSAWQRRKNRAQQHLRKALRWELEFRYTGKRFLLKLR